MAVNISGIGSVYDSLVSKVQGTLDNEFEKNRISGAEYAQVLSSGIVAVLEMSVQSVQNQEKLDAEITSMEITSSIQQAQSEKDLEVKAQQILDSQSAVSVREAQSEKDLEVKAQQILDSQSAVSVREAQSEKDLLTKEAQKALIDKQALSEDEKRLLTARQRTAYDDKLRIEEANALANVTGMFGAGGTALPAGLETAMLDAIAAVTP